MDDITARQSGYALLALLLLIATAAQFGLIH